MYQALYRKWRPQKFEDVVGQEHITQTLRTQVETGRLSHAYLFTGTRGTGKTTCAKILARAVNCEHPVHGDPCNQCPACRGIEDGSILDVVELDAASNNGVDQVRALRDEAVYSPASVKKRVYIVDEVHMLSTAAFNALLKILEEPPEHLMFILATTELHKVPATILSRCQRFSFRRIDAEAIQGRLTQVALAEGIDLTPDGAALLARLADGALRDGLSLLDQCAAAGGKVDRQAVLDSLGLAGNLKIAHLMNHIRRGRSAEALSELADLYAAGRGVGTVLSELAALTRDLLIEKTAPKGGGALLAGGYDQETLDTLSKGLSAQRLLQMLRRLQETQAGLRESANQRTDAELCILCLCDETLDPSPEGISARLSRLEEAFAAGVLPAAAPAAATAAPARQADPPAPAPQEDAPPWDEPPLPEEPEETPRFQVPEPQPEREEAPARRSAAPQRQTTAAAAGGDGAFWKGLLPALRPKLSAWEYMPLTDGATVAGRLENDTLVLYADDQFTYKTINKRPLLEKIAQVASQRAGRTVDAVAREGKPPAVAPAAKHEDQFEDLLRLGAQYGAEID